DVKSVATKTGGTEMTDRVFGDRYYGQRTPLWRTIGQAMPEGSSFDATAAFAHAGLLYRFAKVPLVATLPNGQQLEHSKVGLYREPTADDPTWHELTTVDPKFELLQHDELAAFLDPLTRRWPIDTVGAVELGKTVFVTLRAGGDEIANDQLQRYLLISGGKGGEHALRLSLMDLRLTCTNMLRAAWRRSLMRKALRHDGHLRGELALYTQLLGDIAAGQEQQREAFQVLAQTRITPVQVQEVLAATLREPPLPRTLSLLD